MKKILAVALVDAWSNWIERVCLRCLMVILLSLGIVQGAAAAAGGSVVQWPASDRFHPPAGLTNVVAIAAGGLSRNNMALRSDGTVVGWGVDFVEQGFINELRNVIAIAEGNEHQLALKNDGTVVAWGNLSQGDAGQTTVPEGLSNGTAISAGFRHSMALKRDGTVVAWGSDQYGQSTVPAGLNNVVAIAAGGMHSMALKSDGIVVAWGNGYFGQTDIPAGLNNVVAIAAGYYHSMALKKDGTVVAWGGDGWSGQSDVPSGLKNVVAISAAMYHSLALLDDGSVVAWGWNEGGVTDVPAGLNNVVAIAASMTDNLAITQTDSNSDSTPPSAAPTQSPGANANGWNNGNVTVNWNWTDNAGGSGIDSANCTASSTSTGEGSALVLSSTCKDLAGNTGNASYTVKVDKTSPTVTYSGNSGSYSVDATVNIACAATDALSGIASSSCSNISGAAYIFGLGPHLSAASATDNAGNGGVGSTTFTIVLTPVGLGNLITRFFGTDTSGANGLIAKVSTISSAPNANAKAGKLTAFNNQVDAKIGNPLTADQGAVLKQLAAGL